MGKCGRRGTISQSEIETLSIPFHQKPDTTGFAIDYPCRESWGGPFTEGYHGIVLTGCCCSKRMDDDRLCIVKYTNAIRQPIVSLLHPC